MKLSDLSKQQPQRLSQVSQSPQGNVMTGFNMGSVKGVNIEGKRAEGELENELALEKQKGMEGIKGPSGEVAGRIALARESMQRIRNIKRLLFPSGDTKSFRRDLALASNLPGITIPGMGRVTPQRVGNVPFTDFDDAFVTDAQDLNREMGTILSGRQLIQTGVAARPEETERLVQQFSPNVWSSSDAAMNGLNQLEAFYKDYLNVVDPSGAKGAAPKEQSNKGTLSSGVEYEIL